MNYEGEKFLLKLYRELYNEESVKHSGTKSDDKFELVNKYLKRLESTEKAFTREKEGAVNYLKNRYYDKYVIKEEDIPESYYELQKRIALENGYGHIEYTDELKHKEANILIKEQQKSLDKWLNYLMKENTSYPMWARYWAFQGMLKLGKYDKQKGGFTRRSKGTTSPFVELNAEALALSIGTVVNYQQGENIDDEKLENLVKSGNFGKIYAYNIWKIIEDEKKNLDSKVDTTEGIWKEYKEGSHKEIVHDIEEKGTGWCIAGEEVARGYSEMGKMHIYYTKDKDGNYTVPRVCIREEYDEIAEVRGVGPDQNMEPEMLEIADKKLDEFPDKEEYKKKVCDMNKLTEIYNKSQNSEDLTQEELIFLYEFNEEIEGFGWYDDPRIEEIKNKRNKLCDYAKIFNCQEDEIGFEIEDLYNKNLKIYFGSLAFDDVVIPKNLKIPNIVWGNLFLSHIVDSKGLENLREIKGYADFRSLTTAEGLNNLEIIGSGAEFRSLTTAKGLENLREIKGCANFESLTTAKGLENLERIEENADFRSLTTAKGLENLREIKGYADFNSLTTAEGLNNLEIIGRGAEFSKLISAKGLENLREIKGYADFRSLTTAEGLNNLGIIGSGAGFRSLTTAKGLENLERIDGYADFRGLTTAEGLDNLKKIGEDAIFENLTTAKGLENLREIKGNANFKSLINTNAFDKKLKVSGNINLKNIKFKDLNLNFQFNDETVIGYKEGNSFGLDVRRNDSLKKC